MGFRYGKSGFVEINMKLETSRLTIRYIKDSDWGSLIDIWSDFSQSEFAKYDIPHSTDETVVQAKAKQWTAISPEKEHMFFAVCLEADMIGYFDFHKTDDGYECGYCFHSRYHGNGYAKESLSALIKRLSDDHRTRFVAGTALKNEPSVKLLENVGFEKIGEEQVSFYKDENGNDINFTGGIFLYETT